MKAIQMEVNEGSYVWGEFKLLFFHKDDMESAEVKKSFSIFVRVVDSDYYLSVYIRPRDRLLLMALTDFLLNTFTSSSFLDSSFAYLEDRDLLSYISTIVGWGPVEVVILVDLSRSISTLSRSRLMAKLSSAVRDPFILNLFSSFLNSPLLTKMGPTPYFGSEGIPPSGTDISPVLLNIFLDNFDRAFRSRFPQLPFARYCDEIIVPIRVDRPEDGSLEGIVPIMVSLLEELELSARYLSLLPGESPISYKGGLLILDDKGFINSFTNLEDQNNHHIIDIVEIYDSHICDEDKGDDQKTQNDIIEKSDDEKKE